MNILNKLRAIQSLDELSASQLSELIKFLIKHEEKPSGPYSFNVDDNKQLNNHVYNLFAAKGKLLNDSMADNHSVNTKEPKRSGNHSSSINNEEVFKIISLTIHSHLNSDALHEFDVILNKVKKADRLGEISEISSNFTSSINPSFNFSEPLTKETLLNYSLGNIYTWVAYSIIDELLDSEFKEKFLPAITVLQRNIVYYYLTAGVDYKLLEKMFDEVDSANLSELSYRQNIVVNKESNKVIITNSSFDGIEEIMSQKSIAHTIGPTHIASLIDTNEPAYITEAMKLYCGARQLNDDLHDWMEDFSNGQITYVIVKLFEAASIKLGEYQYTTLLEKMKNAYWDNVLIESCRKIEADIAKSIDLLEKNILKKDSSFVKNFLEPIASSAYQARTKHLYDKEFLIEMKKG